MIATAELCCCDGWIEIGDLPFIGGGGGGGGGSSICRSCFALS